MFINNNYVLDRHTSSQMRCGGKIGGCRGFKLNWWCIKFEKQAEILFDKYYSCVKVIHKVVLDIY